MNITDVYDLAHSVAHLAIDSVDRRNAWHAYALAMLAPDLAHHAGVLGDETYIDLYLIVNAVVNRAEDSILVHPEFSDGKNPHFAIGQRMVDLMRDKSVAREHNKLAILAAALAGKLPVGS